MNKAMTDLEEITQDRPASPDFLVQVVYLTGKLKEAKECLLADADREEWRFTPRHIRALNRESFDFMARESRQIRDYILKGDTYAKPCKALWSALIALWWMEPPRQGDCDLTNLEARLGLKGSKQGQGAWRAQ